MTAALFFLIFWAITFAASAYGICAALGYDRSIPLAVMLGLAPLIPGLLILGRINRKNETSPQQAAPDQFQKRPAYVPPPPK